MSILPKKIEIAPDYPIKYSICTLMTNPTEYQEMLDTFEQAGFNESNSEFFYIDNQNSNRYTAYDGLNLMIKHAKGQYILLCHQDLLLLYDKEPDLANSLERLNKFDPNWAVAGNAGGMRIKKIARHYVNGASKTEIVEKKPAKVYSLDENFLVLKSDARLSFSNDLKGFHFYGTDICLIADAMGYSCYVIDFLLMHKSMRSPEKSFLSIKKLLLQKYKRAWRSRFMQSTCARFYLSGNPLAMFVFNRKIMLTLVAAYYKLLNRLGF
jgi:hypothetical protein